MLQRSRTSQEYWRPATPITTIGTESFPTESACPACGTRYASGARFCYACGSQREKLVVPPTRDTAEFRRYFGLPLASLLFFTLGIACLVVAAVVGFIYKADNLAEWQAIQMWRIEWLLGAAAALLGGILLKR